MWTTTDTDRFMVSPMAVVRAGGLLDIQTWPVVLDLEVSDEWLTPLGALDQKDEHVQAVTKADAELREAGLVDVDGAVIESFSAQLHTLAWPDVELEMRIIDGGTIRRMCLARSGNSHVRALRYGNEVVVETLDITQAEQVARYVVNVLGNDKAAAFAGVSAPRDEIAERLNQCTTTDDFARVFHSVGATRQDATAVASAFASIKTHCEIVAVEHEPGTTTQSSGAVAIYATERGRIVASPSKSPDGRVWTTISPGSGHRIEQAISLLIETLPRGRWLP